jgi:hypothetical protein
MLIVNGTTIASRCEKAMLIVSGTTLASRCEEAMLRGMSVDVWNTFQILQGDLMWNIQGGWMGTNLKEGKTRNFLDVEMHMKLKGVVTPLTKAGESVAKVSSNRAGELRGSMRGVETVMTRGV